MIETRATITSFSKEMKTLILIYLLITSLGFLSALQFVNLTTEGNPTGIEENYLGNEQDLEAAEMKFAKSEKQILNIVHAHMLSLSMLFLILGILVSCTPLGGSLRTILILEPMVSVAMTFGGIYLLTKGVMWMKYLILFSGIAMVISYILSVAIVVYWILRKSN
ncbi:hypothetical protein [Eudoraea chungangensis]|uniref:hypothetical protein n=1 Tax=Eudoraea chungangensis TaxID=1481905 RepID=UPI0023EAA6BF|nr:hypothetical protein [Eudoraea chungangensis]